MQTTEIKIKKLYTDVDGQEVDKNLIPSLLQVKMPVYLFGKYDSQGGYRIAQTEKPVLNNLAFIRCFVVSQGYDFTQFSGLNNVKRLLNTGDLVFLYADDALNPNYFIWIVESLSPLSVNSLYQNTYFERPLKVKEFTVFSQVSNAFNQDIAIIKADGFTLYKTNQINQLAFKNPKQRLNDLIKIPLKIEVNPLVGFATYIPFENDDLTFLFDYYEN